MNISVNEDGSVMINGSYYSKEYFSSLVNEEIAPLGAKQIAIMRNLDEVMEQYTCQFHKIRSDARMKTNMPW